MLIRRIPPIALLATATLSLRAATTAPVPASTADYSEPKKAVASFLAAMQATDSKAIHSAIVAAPEDQPAADAIIALWVAQSKLSAAAKTRFADQSTQYFGAINTQIEARLKALQDAPLKITGDTATITLPTDDAAKQPGGSGGAILLKQIGNDWKLDAASLFNLSGVPPETTNQRITLAKKLIAITNQMADDIAAGKFPSAAEAFQEFWNRSLAAEKEIDQAATRP